MNTQLVDIIFHEVKVERLRQEEKWGIQHHSVYEWFMILTEEFGEIAKAIVEHAPRTVVQQEMIQLIAVCFAWIEDLDPKAFGE